MASTGAISRRVAQVRDEEKRTLLQLMELYGNTLDYDLIYTVALNCNFHLETVSNILFEMTGSAKNTPRTVDSKSQIKKSNARNNEVTPNRQIRPDVLPESISDNIKRGYRVMILMRGLPGSGKSTKAKEIIKSIMGTSNYEQYIFSADDYFINKRTGVYTYNPNKIRDAHEYIQNKVYAKAREGFSPIIVDNTHTQMWEMKCFAGFATNFGYIIEIIEPSTNWAFNEKELARRNVHGVPRVKIHDMLDRYERNITSKELLSVYHLSYKDLKPPMLRQFPAILKEQEAKPPASFTPHGNMSNGLSNGVIQAQEQSQLFQADPADFKELSTNISSLKPKNGNENLASEAVLLESLRNKRMVELNASSFSFDSGTMTFGSPKSQAFPSSTDSGLQGNSEVYLPERLKSPILLRPFSTESSLPQETSNIDIPQPQVNQTRNWRTLVLPDNYPNAWKSWEVVSPVVSPVFSTSPGSCEFENKSTTESSSNTVGSDFSILSNGWDKAGNVRIMNSTSRNINEGTKNDQPRSVTHKITLDKSSMTSDNTIVSDNNQDIEELMTLFVGVPVDYLKDVYEKCGNNLNWTVDLLLDDNKDILSETTMVQTIGCSSSDNEDTVPLQEAADLPLQDIGASTGSEENFAINEDIQMLKTLFSDLPEGYLIETYKKGGSNLDSTVDYILNNDKDYENKSMDDTVMESTMTGEDERSKPPLRESEELKKHIEENVVINKEYYSEHVLKLKDRQNGISSSVDSISLPSTSGTTNSEEFVFIDKGVSQNEFEEEERMELNLGENLISQLESKFGCLNMIPQGFQPVINIPIDLAMQLHAFYVESVFVQMENQTQVLEMLVKEDEEFAKKLQQEEHEDQGDEPSNLTTIMKDQLASSLQQREIEEWVQQNSPDDLASKLTLQSLTSTFPSISKQIIMEILMAHNNSYEETVEVLRASIQNSDDEWEPLAPIPEEIDNRMKIARQELEKECEADNYNKTAEEYRLEAQMHQAKHDEIMVTAQQAKQRKQYQVAQFYSELAKTHTKLFEKANGMAAAAFIEQNANKLKQLNVLDLHNLHVKEALQALDMFIDLNVNSLRESNRTSLELSIITGRGKNSVDGRSKLKPAVQTRLRKRNIPFNNYNFNPGMIKIKINTYTVLTNDL